MHDLQMADRPQLEMRWLPVTDASGSIRMQAVWIDATATAPASVHHAA